MYIDRNPDSLAPYRMARPAEGSIPSGMPFANMPANGENIPLPATGKAEPGIAYDDEVKDMKRLGAIRCATCESRRYQDGSADSGVSFQTPQNISPQSSIGKVRSHENEHVRRENQKAEREGRRIMSQTVVIHMDTCPECGRAYASGGVTKTLTKPDFKKDAFMDNLKEFMGNHFGNYVDKRQ